MPVAKPLKCDQPKRLVTATRQLLVDGTHPNVPLTLFDLSARSGLPFHWLRKFRSGETDNPSANRVQHLYEHLTGRQLTL